VADLPLLKASAGDLDRLYTELVRLLCQEPFVQRLAEEDAFNEYRDTGLQACD
jgi:hypothetical protein